MLWVLLVLLLLLLLLLFLPLEVEVDSAKEVYEVRWRGIFWFWLDTGGEEWRVFMRIFFWKFPIQLKNLSKDAAKAKTPPVEKKQPDVKKPSRRKGHFTIKQFQSVFHYAAGAIRVKRFYLNWDTEDYILNAYLYPLFGALSRGRRRLRINFSGIQEISLLARTRLAWLAWAGIRILLTLKF